MLTSGRELSRDHCSGSPETKSLLLKHPVNVSGYYLLSKLQWTILLKETTRLLWYFYRDTFF